MRESRMHELESRLSQTLNKLVGKKPWATFGSAYTGRILVTHWGRKIRRDQALPAYPWIDEIRRFHEGEVVLRVEGAWRLEDANRIICGSCDFEDGQSEWGPLLEVMRQRKVLAVEWMGFSHDLRIAFEEGLILSTFCDMAPSPDTEEGFRTYYHVSTPKEYFCVERGGNIVWRPETPDEEEVSG